MAVHKEESTRNRNGQPLVRLLRGPPCTPVRLHGPPTPGLTAPFRDLIRVRWVSPIYIDTHTVYIWTHIHFAGGRPRHGVLVGTNDTPGRVVYSVQVVGSRGASVSGFGQRMHVMGVHNAGVHCVGGDRQHCWAGSPALGRRAVSGALLTLAGLFLAERLPAQSPKVASQNYTQADVRFMQGMIMHHAQAVAMSDWAASHGARPDVVLCNGSLSRRPMRSD